MTTSTKIRFNLLDTEATYRKLLATDAADERKIIFRQELIDPFAGLLTMMGGAADPALMFEQWGMSVEQVAPENRAAFEGKLDKLADFDAFDKAKAALEAGREAFAPYADRIPTEEITFGLVICKAMMGADRGYSGFGAIPGYIMTTYSDPNDYNLPRVQGATAHEFHHNVLASVSEMPMIANVGTYIIAEGLAEAFAGELYGDDILGYYVTDFDDTTLDTAKSLIKDALHVSDFNAVRGYIFGDTIMGQHNGVPDYAGYAIGYRIVQAYLQQTGCSVVDATFIPADEIIRESGYFD